MALFATALGLGSVWAGEQETRAGQAIGLLVLTLVPRSIVVWVRHCYVALEDAGWIPRYELVFRGGEALVGTAALFLWGDLRVICAIHLSAWLLEAVVALRKLTGASGFSLVPGRNFRLLKRVFRVSLYFMLSLWLVNLSAHIGILGLGLLREEAATVGYFGTAMQFMTTFLLLPFAFGQAFLPSLSRGYHRGGPAPVVLTFVIKGLLVAGGFIAILAHSYGAWIVTLLLGDRFAAAGEVFASLSWAVGPYAVTLVAVQALNGIGGRALATVLALAIVAAQVTLLIALLPLGALAAATAALVAAASLGCLLGILFIHRRLGIEGHGWWLHPLIAVAGTGAAMSFVILPEPWTAPAATAVLGLLVWLLRVFRGADFHLIRDRLQAAAG
jgi:O-antigen/teichoic acid export membrane protein